MAKRVLVVEDNSLVRLTVCHYVHAMGWTTMEARNGKTALTIVTECRRPIDALLTDLRLPDIGGLDLARQARSAQAGCPILFMSGNPPPAASLPGQVLRKPFDEVTLRRALLNLMSADALPE